MGHGHPHHDLAGVDGLDGQFGQGTTYGDKKLHTARVCLHSELEAL